MITKQQEKSSHKVVAREIEKLAQQTPPAIVKKLQQRMAEKRKAMPRGGTAEVLSSRVCY